MESITSSHNPSLRLARKLLQSARERERSGKILLDGMHLVGAYAERFDASGALILLDEAVKGDPDICRLIDALPKTVRVCSVPGRLFREISPVDTPSGIVAVCDVPVLPAPRAGVRFSLLLDGVQNPGNLGSILRTAAATDVDMVFLTSSCTDPWSPRCLRGGMGAQFIVPVRTDVAPLEAIREFDGLTVATAPRGGQRIMDACLEGEVLVVFGSEGAGLSPEILNAVDATVRIPLCEGVESLNVAAAVAVCCYERLRQMAVRRC